MEQSALGRNFVVVLLSPSALRIPEGERWNLREVPSTNAANVEVVLTGHYVDEGFTNHVPRGIHAEVSGVASDFDEALQVFARAADLLTPVLSLATNCYVPPFRHRLAYEATEGAQYRPFRQWFPVDDQFPKCGRWAAFEPFSRILGQYLSHQESARIYRAMVQYQEAIASWRSGEELRSVMHLWMAVEALTKSFLRRELQQSNVEEIGLCSNWEIEKKHLDSEVRKRLIFHGDDQTYTAAKNTSDSVEHMFKDFPQLHRMGVAARDKTAHHVRSSILDLLQVSSALGDLVPGSVYEQPQNQTQFDGVALSGRLESGGGNLAADGNSHPVIVGNYSIDDFAAKGEGYEIRIKNNFRPVVGTDVKFHADSVGAELPLSSLDVSVKRAGS